MTVILAKKNSTHPAFDKLKPPSLKKKRVKKPLLSRERKGWG